MLLSARTYVQFFFAASLATAPFSANAEYRAYQLTIGKEGATARDVIGTLDNIQYPEYYPLESGETVTLVKSWMCRGRQGDFSPACPDPATLPPADSAPNEGPVPPAAPAP